MVLDKRNDKMGKNQNKENKNAKIGKKDQKEAEKRPEMRKDSTYAWLSLVLVLFFWIPLLNVFFFLPASIYFGIKAMKKARKEPTKHGGFWIALISVVVASVSFAYSLVVLIMSLSGKIPAP